MEGASKFPPVLYLFDSYPGDRTVAESKIRSYLADEWTAKVSMGNVENLRKFDESEMQLICPVKLEQQNGYDCGIFLLTYLEKIFER